MNNGESIGLATGSGRAFVVILILMGAVLATNAQTGNYLYEGFEAPTALDKWSFDGPWEIGIPSYGPAPNATGSRAFAGAKCAATVLGGNYSDDTYGRLVSPAFVVPPTSAHPRLRFWHYYSFACGDGGEVQIKTGASAWARLNQDWSGYSASGSEVWSQPGFDLSAYAGQSIQIGFYFYSSTAWPCGNSVAPGWYIDEFRVVTGAVQTLTANVPEGFELGFRDWSVQGGSWEIGVPTYGPATNAFGSGAHDGTNCAATSLAGNYAEDTSGRLVSPPFRVPGGDGHPRLQFWRWYSFGCGDAGYTQIKVEGGDWVSLEGFGADGSAVWSRGGVDLQPYVGQTVQVGFLFTGSTAWPCGVSPGAGMYIDDVLLLTNRTTLDNPESFEAGFGDWTVEGGSWEVGVPASGPLGAHEGTNCAATVLAGNYHDDTSGRLVSPPFTVPPAALGPRLRFWHWYNFSCADSGKLQIKAQNSSWQDLATYTSNSSGVWGRPSVDLSPFQWQTVQIGFLFSSSSAWPCGNSVAPGWYVDEVRLLNDFGLGLGSSLTRTQEVACVPLRVAEAIPCSTVTVSLHCPPGLLSDFSVSTTGDWVSSPLVQGPDSRMVLTLQKNGAKAQMGIQTIGSICYRVVSAESAFVPLLLENVVVSTFDGSSPRAHLYNGRAVVIGHKAMLEAWRDGNGQRGLTLYGPPGKEYELDLSTTTPLSTANWTLWSRNVIPPTLSTNGLLTGTLTNAPRVFVRARER